MIESWLPVILGVVIVAGMVTVRIWSALISHGLPLLRDWIVDEYVPWGRDESVPGGAPSRAELALRIDELETELRFLESLLEEPRGPRSSHAPKSR